MCQILANIKSDYFVSHDKMYNSELWDTGKKIKNGRNKPKTNGFLANLC